jgi:hypothetical protein
MGKEPRYLHSSQDEHLFGWRPGADLLVNRNTMSVTIDLHSLILFVFRSSAIFSRLIGGAQRTLQVCVVGGLLALLKSSQRHHSMRRETNIPDVVYLWQGVERPCDGKNLRVLVCCLLGKRSKTTQSSFPRSRYK